MDFINITTTGNAIDFGESMNGANNRGAAVVIKSTRGLFVGGICRPCLIK